MKTVYKPPGIPVFAPHDDAGGDCVLARLLRAEPWRVGVAFPEAYPGGIAHRLDTSTSGALAIADDPAELERIRVAFAAKALVKTYWFRSAREVPWNENATDAALAHHRKRRDRMIARRGQDTPHRGKWHDAETSFRRLGAALWEARMRTGVMHQIRCHAAFVGIPISGDPLYGGGPTPADAPEGAVFLLHHVGFEGDGWRTDPVPHPTWAAGPGRAQGPPLH